MTKRRIECVVIGSSAGGDSALYAILPDLPADLSVPIIIAQHNLDNTLFARLLRSKTSFPVEMAAEGRIVEVGCPHVYVVGSDCRTRLSGRPGSQVIFVTDPVPDKKMVLPNIDEVMRSAAASFGPALLGVVLTGMEDDGAQGIRAIHFAVGLTMVQDPADAEFKGMPSAALRTGVIDFVVPLSRIAATINRLTI